MSREFCRWSGMLLVILPSVMLGVGDPSYMENPLRQDLWRAGHAHAGVLLILMPAAFFLSVLQPAARQPNGFIYLAYVGASLLAIGVVVLGVGVWRSSARDRA